MVDAGNVCAYTRSSFPTRAPEIPLRLQACAACELGRIIKVEGKYDTRYEGLTLHDLRRSAARDLLQGGVPETVIMKIGGWKTRAVFDSYAVASTADLTTAMRKWEAASLQMGKDNVKLTASVEG